MQGTVSSSAGAGAVLPPRFSVDYLKNGTAVMGVLLILANAVIVGNFHGVTWAVPWAAASIGLLTMLVCAAVRVQLGDKRAEREVSILQPMLVLAWMASAVALWSTGNVGAWIIAVTIPASWAIHIIFTSRGNLGDMLRALAICTVPMLVFLVIAAWTNFPMWAAVAGTVSAVFMVASIAESARFSHANFLTLQKAVADAEATRARLEFAIQGAGDGYFEIDFENMEATVNPSLAVIVGAEHPTGPLEGFHATVHEDERDAVFSTIEKARLGEVSAFKQEIRVRLASGEWCWMQLRAQVIAANAVHGRKLIGTVVDLTAWKKIEAELRAAKETAEASSNAKSQFLANMSHEIRTPLNGVLGMAQALDADDLTPAQTEKVAVILDSGKSLMSLLNDVLDLTKIEAGKMEISTVPGDFLHTMKRTRQLFQSTAEEKGLDLMVRYDSSFPQRLAYDPTRVRQCVSNLLSNAIKFTSAGRVEVGITARRIGATEHMISVEIVDTGIGMSEETCNKLFSVFTQADGATTRRFGGSGLGLAISRQLARLMGGDITVKSVEGKGSTFTFTFRAMEAAAAAAPSPTQAKPVDTSRKSLRGLRVLLTDDNAINRQVIKLFLAPQGCDIVEATNGKEALDQLAQHDFDIVLLDVHMPVMDGKEAIARLRAVPKWKDLPVIALTADAMSGDRERYLALGMTDYISKPVDQRELIAKMHQVKGLEAPASAQEAKTA